ncbi:MAG: hypothetical protein JW986_00775 [Methanotrichaceae archaeon]|nr:hypothetical protein [Methanotrichaceae archaeon]
MLMKLGRWLRLAGEDVANPEGCIEDADLIVKARVEGRVLLTRDKALLARCKKGGADCLLILSSDLDDQLAQMVDLGLDLRLDPQRCTLCNAPLEKGGDRWICTGCGKAYWQGSHWVGIDERMARIRDRI